MNFSLAPFVNSQTIFLGSTYWFHVTFDRWNDDLFFRKINVPLHVQQCSFYGVFCWMNNAIHQEFVLFYLMTHKQHLILLVINSNEFECFVDFNEKQIIIYVTKRKEKKTIGVACFAWIILWRFFSSYFSSGKLTWWSWRIEVNKLSILFLLLLHGCF